MVRPYSQDLRERVVASAPVGRTCRETAASFGIGVASVVRWSQRRRVSGERGECPARRCPPERTRAQAEYN